MNASIDREAILRTAAYADTLQDQVIGGICPFRRLTAPGLDALGISNKQVQERANQLLAADFDWQTARDVSIYEAIAAAGLIG